MKFTVGSKDLEDNKFPKLADGEMKFEITGIEETTSPKSGNRYAKVMMNVTDVNGMRGKITDIVMLESGMLWKLKHLCNAVNVGFSDEANGDEQEISDDDLLYKTGSLVSYYDTHKSKYLDDDGNPKILVNLKVRDYIAKESQPNVKTPDNLDRLDSTKAADDSKTDKTFDNETLNDDIPF